MKNFEYFMKVCFYPMLIIIWHYYWQLPFEDAIILFLFLILIEVSSICYKIK